MNEAVIIQPPKHESEMAIQAKVEPEDLGLDKEGVVKAAKLLGLQVMPDTLMASHALGTAMKKVGVLKIGRTMLYSAMEHAKTGADQCQQILADSSDPELRAAILPTKLGFAKELRESAMGFIKSAELDGNDDSDNRNRIKPFGAGQPAGPVVIAQQAVVNNNTTQVKT